MFTHRYKSKIVDMLVICCLGIFLFGCEGDPGNKEMSLQTARMSPTTVIPSIPPSSTHENLKETETPTPISDVNEQAQFSLRISPNLPETFITGIHLPSQIKIVSENDPADVELRILNDAEGLPGMTLSTLVFALVAPFPTILDNVSSKELIDFWHGKDELPDGFKQLLMTESTSNLLTQVWGETRTSAFEVMPEEDLLKAAWENNEKSLEIVPFDLLDPRWKVIRVDGISPLDSTFDPDHYPLQVKIGLVSQRDIALAQIEEIAASIKVPASNRDAGKLTSLIMTGTTALVRYTALKMEENGVLYPAADISDLLRDADFTHISNEVSFFEDCPPAVPVRVEQRFCSNPAYFDLLESIDVDLIELTGNHILDWGYAPLLFTLQIYENNHIPYFGGGRNLEQAQQPLIVNQHGQELFFIGCSPAGPENVWATEDLPGSNPCNWDLLTAQLTNALSDKMITIITFQHIEVEDYIPHSSQRIDFLRAAKSGAVIVSGSQAHFAQAMTFVGDHFVHYGLGNLFFDQMYGENPHEFVDKHYFYQGRYISTELITLTLEDSAKPRVMTINERTAFLQTIFDHSNWDLVFQEGGE